MPSRAVHDRAVQSFLDELHERIAVKVVRDVAELPDRTSPDGDPNMLIVTAAELKQIVLGALSANDQ